MPFLRVEQGSCPGQILEISGERVVIGRHPDCGIVLDNAAISRQHACICRSVDGYLVQDLRSRNRTLLNGNVVEGTAELHDQDTISICELTFRFLMQPPAQKLGESTAAGTDPAITPPQGLRTVSLTATADGHAVGQGGSPAIRGSGSTPTVAGVPQPPVSIGQHAADGGGSSILGTVNLDDASGLLLAIKPEQKLRAVLDIGKALANALELKEVLDRTLAGLFRIFPQADHGCVLLKHGEPMAAGEPPQMKVHAARSRHGDKETGFGVSRTVVRRALQAGEAVLSADAVTDDRFSESESVASLSIRSIMCMPLETQSGDPFGVIQLDSGMADRPFNRDDLDTLASVAGQIGLAVENARLHAELVAQRDMRRELDFAMQVQLGFLPHQPPVVPGYEFGDHYAAADRVGGDYFDYIEFPDGRVAVTVGDVAGKGVPAALLMARLMSSARYQLLTRPTPGAAMAALNNEIARTALGHRFITCAFAVVDPKAHTLTIANAGHMAPLIRCADGTTEGYGQNDSGMPVGILRDQEFIEVVRPLAPGDMVLLYTDGVTEAMDATGDLYGRIRLTQTVASGPSSIGDSVRAVVAEVGRFSRNLRQRDDICLVGFRRLPK